MAGAYIFRAPAQVSCEVREIREGLCVLFGQQHLLDISQLVFVVMEMPSELCVALFREAVLIHLTEGPFMDQPQRLHFLLLFQQIPNKRKKTADEHGKTHCGGKPGADVGRTAILGGHGECDDEDQAGQSGNDESDRALFTQARKTVSVPEMKQQHQPHMDSSCDLLVHLQEEAGTGKGKGEDGKDRKAGDDPVDPAEQDGCSQCFQDTGLVIKQRRQKDHGGQPQGLKKPGRNGGEGDDQITCQKGKERGVSYP